MVASTSALPTSSPVLDGRDDGDLHQIYDFTLTILDKKYDLYEWTHNKLNTLLSVTSLVIGGVLVLATSDRFKPHHHSWIGNTLFISTLVIFAGSIALSLYNTRPIMDSGIGNKQFRNLRQVVGTHSYTPAEYLDAISGLSLRDMIVQNVHQIKGMNRIVMLNQLEIRRVTILVLIGFVFMLTWLIYVTV